MQLHPTLIIHSDIFGDMMVDNVVQLKSGADISLSDYGLEDFSKIPSYMSHPIEILMCADEIVGLKVYGTLDKACKDKILSMENIQLLYLGQARGITNKWIGCLAELPRLRKLCLWHTCFGNSGAKMLANSKSLEILDIRQTKIVDEGFEHLSRIESLKGLHAYLRPSINYSTLVCLKNLKKLEALLLQRTWNSATSHYIPKAMINCMTEGLTNLEELNIDYIGQGSETGLEFVNNLPKLRTLSIQNFSFDELSVDVFAKDIPLQFLDISQGYIGSMSLVNRLLSSLRSIDSLRMHDFTVYDEDVPPKIIRHVPNVYCRKKGRLYWQRDQRELCEKIFPKYVDSCSNSAHNYLKYFSWDQI